MKLYLIPVILDILVLPNGIANRLRTNLFRFSGTVPVKDGFRFGSKFRYEMEDKKLNRKLSSEYEVDVISEEER